MNAEEQEIDGTKPSEGGSIVISHDEEPVNNKAPGSTRLQISIIIKDKLVINLLVF